MKGLQVWAHSQCRSTFAFYEGIAKYYNVPFRICVAYHGKFTRKAYGWNMDEFHNYDCHYPQHSLEKCIKLYEDKKDWFQIFGTYQQDNVFNSILRLAKENSPGVIVCSEAPMNMMSPGIRRICKRLYLNYFLPYKLQKRIQGVDCYINFSGGFTNLSINPGWDEDRVIHAGYYPPPLDKSSLNHRKWEDFSCKKKVILLSGGCSWNRGVDVAIEALKYIGNRRNDIKVLVTGQGSATKKMRRIVSKYSLPVEFCGFISLDSLIQLYQDCFLFLGSGREEPWGIRVNDALNCGAPLLISDGMGASRLVEDYKCGWTFRSGSAKSLAAKIEAILLDSKSYQERANNAVKASRLIHPIEASKRICTELGNLVNKWSI